MSTPPSPEARADYNSLLEALMPFAEEMLKKQGGFFPFGATVTTAGEVAMQAADVGSEEPEPQEVMAALVQGCHEQARAGSIRAVGLCSDGRIELGGKPVDAVIISLEHVSGNASKTCVPYSKGFFGKYKFGELVAGPGETRVFLAA